MTEDKRQKLFKIGYILGKFAAKYEFSHFIPEDILLFMYFYRPANNFYLSHTKSEKGIPHPLGA